MLLKPTKYQQFDAASGRLKAHLGAPGGRPDPPAIFTCSIKAERIGQFSRNGTKITKNTNMPMCQYAFKTNEISTIWCRLRAPEGPPGGPGGRPDPPGPSRCIIKAKRIRSIFKERVKRRNKDHETHEHANVPICV